MKSTSVRFFKLGFISLFTALCVFLPTQGQTQTASEISVFSLFESRSFIPGAFLPLKLSGSLVTSQLQVLSTQVTSDNGADCRVLKDPYVAFTYLLKCRTATKATVQFRLFNNNKVLNVAYGPMDIKLPAADLIPVEEDDGKAALILKGAQSFSARCVACHNPAVTKKGRTLAALKTSMTAQPMMNGTQTAYGGVDLTYLATDTAALEAIEAYLGSLK